jgi:hypothetical protein
VSAPNYANLGSGFDGKPVLRQTGHGPRQLYPLRFASVWAASESAAKLIQTHWRSQQ